MAIEVMMSVGGIACYGQTNCCARWYKIGVYNQLPHLSYAW